MLLVATVAANLILILSFSLLYLTWASAQSFSFGSSEIPHVCGGNLLWQNALCLCLRWLRLVLSTSVWVVHFACWRNALHLLLMIKTLYPKQVEVFGCTFCVTFVPPALQLGKWKWSIEKFYSFHTYLKHVKLNLLVIFGVSTSPIFFCWRW